MHLHSFSTSLELKGRTLTATFTEAPAMAPSPWRQRRVQSAELPLPRPSGGTETPAGRRTPQLSVWTRKEGQKESRDRQNTQRKVSLDVCPFLTAAASLGSFLKSDLLTACSGGRIRVRRAQLLLADWFWSAFSSPAHQRKAGFYRSRTTGRKPACQKPARPSRLLYLPGQSWT